MTSPAKTEIKVFEYNENADSFNCTVNEERREISAEFFFNQYTALQDNIAADFSKPQSAEDYCLGMIYDMHFKEEPSDLCYTFYVVHH
jgi:hypothetical protein